MCFITDESENVSFLLDRIRLIWKSAQRLALRVVFIWFVVCFLIQFELLCVIKTVYDVSQHEVTQLKVKYRSAYSAGASFVW